MNKEQFWAIIDKARESAGSWEDMFGPLVDELSQLESSDILHWGQIFGLYQKHSYKNKLWAAAYVINGGCSDDGFDYFRGWLTAQGKAVFLKSLSDPDSLADVDACEGGSVDFEEMLSVAPEAFFRKLSLDSDYNRFYEELDKRPLSDEENADILSEIVYGDDIDIEWNEDDAEAMRVLLPKLCDAFDW